MNGGCPNCHGTGRGLFGGPCGMCQGTGDPGVIGGVVAILCVIGVMALVIALVH